MVTQQINNLTCECGKKFEFVTYVASTKPDFDATVNRLDKPYVKGDNFAAQTRTCKCGKPIPRTHVILN